MHSELHERLEYLVNYSSQLIFVSGDSIAQQQRTLEAFVFQQHDDTEIAYVTAEPDMDLSDYRRQLCRQLLGQVVGSYVRPLNELLSSLNQHEGPILITLTQAQHIPDKLLQELWDLVLQSRFAGNKQHLNVLLFGETKWAENAKQWLPAKNTDTPLLISSQSVHSDPEESELDKLIARKRENFQQHMARRYGHSNQATRPKLKSPWFLTAVASVFLVIFGSLVAWQYGNEIGSLFSPIGSEPVPESNDMVAPGSAFDKIVEPPPEAATAASDTPARREPALPSDIENDSQLVTQWREAVDALPRQSRNPSEAEASVQDPVSPGAVRNNEKAQAPQADPETRTELGATLPLTKDDIAKGAEQQTQPPEKQQLTDNNATKMADSINVDGTKLDTGTPARSDTDNEMLAGSVRQNDFMLQLAGLKDKELLAQFVSDNNLSALTKVYRTQRYGGDWYVLLFHQPFSSLKEARQALSSLPEYQGRENAFVKRGSQILEELKEVEPK